MDKMYDVPKKRNRNLDPKFSVKTKSNRKKLSAGKKELLPKKDSVSTRKKPSIKPKKDITKIPGFKFGRGTE